MLKIYLADLVYDTLKTNYVVPLNVAYLAAYAKKKYVDDVDIRIFKYPHELERSIKSAPPDILGLSNYSWNERLNQVFLRLVKRVNPNVVTVMGGPNIRTDRDGIKAYLSSHDSLDYYILFEGEVPFSNLIEQVLNGAVASKPPIGCAGLIKGRLYFEPIDPKKKPKEIDYPSPYLAGLLDEFLADPNMIPLFETNRGCPFACTYCSWGIAALSKVRKRSLDQIYDELDYVVQKSAKQVNWIFGDANFGILDRDLDIAKKINRIMNDNGYPIGVTLWHSKNTSKRNIEIAKTIRDGEGYIAIQTTDPAVLEACGRGNIQFKHIKAQVDFYKGNGLEVATDVLIGLPNETAQSHLNTLISAFNLGFGKINPYNIRMLPGSQYETATDRLKYGVKTKFRPIFGAYGIYDGQRVFEIEESVRATRDMAEPELDDFKVLHWLIDFCWNIGICKPILRLAQEHEINPALALHELSSSKHPLLANLFSRMKEQSMSEWRASKKETIAFYEKHEHFLELESFVKLNQLWVATIFQDSNVTSTLLSELKRVITAEMIAKQIKTNGTLDRLADIVSKLVCVDLLQPEFSVREKVSGETLSYILDEPGFRKIAVVDVEIYRDKEDAIFCHRYLNPDGKRDFSIPNITRFLEMGGKRMLMNRIRLVSKDQIFSSPVLGPS